MKLLVIDANLINSAVRTPLSRISRFILRVEPGDVELYAPTYLQSEIDRHLLGISEDTGRSLDDLTVTLDCLYSRISFIDDADLPYETIIKAMRLVRDIDPDDVLYVALNDERTESSLRVTKCFTRAESKRIYSSDKLFCFDARTRSA